VENCGIEKLGVKIIRKRLRAWIVIALAAMAMVIVVIGSAKSHTEPTISIHFDGLSKTGTPSTGDFTIANTGKVAVFAVFFRLWTEPANNRDMAFQTDFPPVFVFHPGQKVSIAAPVPPSPNLWRAEFEYSQYSTKQRLLTPILNRVSGTWLMKWLTLCPWIWSGEYWVRQISTGTQSLPRPNPEPPLTVP